MLHEIKKKVVKVGTSQGERQHDDKRRQGGRKMMHILFCLENILISELRINTKGIVSNTLAKWK